MVMRSQIRRWELSSGRNALSAQDMRPEKYSGLGSSVSDVLTVPRIAQEIEPNPNAMLSWYQHTQIDELDSLTAEQLVHEGRAAEVIRFLRAIQAGVRH
jgi:hypothetical protein